MKILLSARNAMGDVAEYEIEADTQKDVLHAVQLLYARTGIVRVKVHPDYVDKVHGMPRTM